MSRLEPAADDLSRTAQVRIRVAHLPLVAGSVVEVALGVHRQTGLSLPLGAVMTDADGHASVELYQPAAKTVSIASVHVLGNAGDRVTVSGIRTGDLVVTQGQYEAHPGDRVHVVGGFKS